jgi:arylformamidase
MSRREWIDVSRPLRHGMLVYPGDPPPQIRQAEVHGLRVTSLRMSAHAGTHMDAPLHFFAGGASIDQIPPEVCIGPARVCESVDILSERMLFKNSQGLSAAEAERLVAQGVKLVGVDTLSVDVMDDESFPAHRILLEAGVWIIEMLDLSQVEPGEYEMICLPLKIEGADGAPARVMLATT